MWPAPAGRSELGGGSVGRGGAARLLVARPAPLVLMARPAEDRRQPCHARYPTELLPVGVTARLDDDRRTGDVLAQPVNCRHLVRAQPLPERQTVERRLPPEVVR